MDKGFFISFEGLDGSGKTTQIKKLFDYLTYQKFDVIMLREPGGVLVSEKIRELVIDNDMSPYTEALLYAAARAELVNSVIRPAISAGKIVLCDRFIDSSLAYQGYARDLGVENVYNINKFGTGGILPDLTFFMDIPPEASLARRKSTSVPDRIESEHMDFHHKVYNGYKDISVKFSSRIHIIDALGKPVDIHNEITAVILNFFEY